MTGRELAKVHALNEVLARVMKHLAALHAEMELVQQICTTLINDQVGSRALVGHTQSASTALDKVAGNIEAAIDRVEHIEEALRS